MSRRVTVTFDAIEPRRIADFWAAALGYTTPDPPAGFDTWDAFADANDIPSGSRGDIAAIEDPDGSGPQLLFLRVPEDKSAKNRVHLDVHCGVVGETTSLEDHQAAIARVVAELTAVGATEGEHFLEHVPWTVMTDPEGNEFCVV